MDELMGKAEHTTFREKLEKIIAIQEETIAVLASIVGQRVNKADGVKDHPTNSSIGATNELLKIASRRTTLIIEAACEIRDAI